MDTLNRRGFIRQASLIAAVPLLNTELLYSKEKTDRQIHRVLTCNIRVDLPEDAEKGFGWQARKDICARIISNHKPDIICLQEVLKGQMNDLKKAFPGFGAVGFDGPEMDANPVGYHGIAKNPVMFSKKRYELLHAGTFWLSETPLEAGSISWNSARARHANWVRLKDKKTGTDFRIVNVHLDHKSQEAREKQIQLLLKEASQYPAAYPQLLAGDMNAHAGNPVYGAIRSSGWTDTYTVIHGEREPGHTVHLFQGERYEKKDTGRKIDFIFLKGDVAAVGAGIIKDSLKGVYPSDHYFVSADVRFA